MISGMDAYVYFHHGIWGQQGEESSEDQHASSGMIEDD